MTRFALFLLALFASFLFVLASPISVADGEVSAVDVGVSDAGAIPDVEVEDVMVTNANGEYEDDEDPDADPEDTFFDEDEPILGESFNSTSTEDDSVHLEKRLTRYGRGTWFYPGLGNCGKWNGQNDMIVAIGKRLYDRNRASNCDQWVKITNAKNGKTVYAKTRDSCPSCGDSDLDLSPAAFKKLAPLSQGVVRLSWHFMGKGWKP